MPHEMPSVLTRGLNLKKKKLFSNFDLIDKECNVHSIDKGRMLQHKGSDAGNHKIFFLVHFNLWHLFLMLAIYLQTKTLIGFWCKWGLNLISLI